MIIDYYHSPSKAHIKCEDCGRERVVQRVTTLLDKIEHPCRSCSNKRNGSAKAGKYTAWNSGKRYSIRETERTEYVDTHGYVQVWCGRGDGSRGRKDGYALKHRLIMEDILGRKLTDEEVVHHIDGDKLNNEPSNLYLCKTKNEHRHIHGDLEKVSFELFKMGVIGFDFESGNYYIKEDLSKK